ncbi:MAG: hypothetical protein ACOH1J_05335 [Microbacteriaceae bacterium]
MALENHPHVFQFGGRAWVSALPREQALAQLTAQRAWDVATLRAQRWWVAIAVGSGLGTAVSWWLGNLVNAPAFANIVTLPIGFAIGAVLGAVVNKRLLGDLLTAPVAAERPTVPPLTRVPTRVVRTAEEFSTVQEIIALSRPTASERDNTGDGNGNRQR